MLLNKESLINITKRKVKNVVIDEYDIKIVEMSILQQLEIEKIIQKKNDNTSLLVPVIKYSVVDENNQTFLSDEDIQNMSASFAANLFKECISFNSIDEKELEDRAKNC